MKTRLLSLLLLAITAACSLSSCAPDEPKRKKVVGPDASQYSSLPWNRPRSWEGNAKYGGMVPGSRLRGWLIPLLTELRLAYSAAYRT